MTFETRSHDAEPNSISPMAVNVARTGQWEINLHNLHSGERIDFAIPKFDDDDDDVVAVTGELAAAILPKKRSHVARNVMGAMTAVVLVAGLGFAAFRGRATLQRSFANASAHTHAAQTSAPVVNVAPPPAPVVVAAPPPAAATPAPAPAPAADAPPALPSLSAADLPNAKGKLKSKGKHGKRAK